MKRTTIWPVVAAVILSLSGCSVPQSGGIDGDGPSSDVTLTADGTARQPIAFLPTEIKLSSGELDDAEAKRKKATCTLASSAFTAQAKIPARLSLPTYGKSTPEMTITCDVDGDTVTQTAKPVNLTVQAYQAQAAGHMLIGFGLVGAAISGTQSANRDKSKDVWGYSNVIQVQY
ncbi:hypothetical protein [Tropicibacter sp. Alg240-R139]|uniref:hypothetical protein n=1 Tax=Tropicibacter sp. Alg240-R139 TaxID=2305991 RepID=UPI0013E0DC20|nr:hypothetical protein [Tropicibacter sp. Alg240-R139]